IGAASVEPAPLSVAEPPLLLLLDPLAAGAGALELLLELLLLEPHAAIPSTAATARMAALMRLVLTFVSLIRCWAECLLNSPRRCYRVVNRSLVCCLGSAARR